MYAVLQSAKAFKIYYLVEKLNILQDFKMVLIIGKRN